MSLANAQNDTTGFLTDAIAIRFDSTELKVDTIETVVKEPKSWDILLDNQASDNVRYPDRGRRFTPTRTATSASRVLFALTKLNRTS